MRAGQLMPQRPPRSFRQARLDPSGGGWWKDYRVWLVSGLLLLAVGLVFGQNVGHDFLESRRPTTTSTRIRTLRRPDAGRTSVGVYRRPARRMVSAGVSVPHAGLPAVRPETGRPLSDQLLLHGASSVAVVLVLLRMTSQRAVPEAAQVSGGGVASAGPSQQQASERCPKRHK